MALLGNLSAILRWHLNASGDLSDLIDYPSLEMVDPPIQTALVCIYSLTAALSVLGNVTVILVLTFGKRSSGDLRAFLINLAVSDVTMAIFSIPFTYTIFMLGRWIFHPAFCSVVIVMQHVSVIVSVYTLTAIGIDRYNAIMHPFERRLTSLKTKLILAGIWLVAILISAVQIHVARPEPFKYDGEWHWECGEHWESPSDGKSYTIAIFTVTFFLPMLSLAFTYTSVARRLWLRSSPGNADPHRDLAQLRAKRKIVKMLVTIVVLFTLCWLPLQTFLLLYYFVPGFDSFNTEQARHTYALAYFACHWLANANSLVNPLVYCFMSDNFRMEFRYFGPKDLATLRSIPLMNHTIKTSLDPSGADLRDLVRPRSRIKKSFKSQPRDSVRSGSTRTTVCLFHRGGSSNSTNTRVGTGSCIMRDLKPDYVTSVSYHQSEASSQL